MNLHVSYFTSDISTFNLKLSGKNSNPGIQLVKGSKYVFLRCLSTEHLNKKWTSSSTLSEQNVQNLFSGFKPTNLPVSIASLWFESLNLVTCRRIETFFISVKYFSRPGSVLNRAYVLNLLEFSLIVPKDDSWKLS